MSRSVRTDYESLRAAQARAQQADRIGPDRVEGAAEALARDILTRRRIKCRANSTHTDGGCPKCGL